MEGLQRPQTNKSLVSLRRGNIFSLFPSGNNRCYLLCAEKSALEEDVLGDYLSQFASKMTRLAKCLLSHWHIE